MKCEGCDRRNTASIRETGFCDECWDEYYLFLENEEARKEAEAERGREATYRRDTNSITDSIN